MIHNIYKEKQDYVVAMTVSHFMLWTKTYEYVCTRVDDVHKLVIPFNSKRILYPHPHPRMHDDIDASCFDCIEYNNNIHLGDIRIVTHWSRPLAM